MKAIVPNYITGMIYGCLVEAYASEHNARMMAMKSATDSAESLISELSIVYNRGETGRNYAGDYRGLRRCKSAAEKELKKVRDKYE